MARSLTGPWNEGAIASFLTENTIPMRLSCVAEDGFPRVVSVWFAYDGLNFHCVSHATSPLIKLLQRNDRVGFEVAPNEPPYCGVRGQGMASLSDEGGGEQLVQLLRRYLGGTDSSLAQWLLSRADDEVLITIAPVRLFTWDYSERMSDS